MIVPYSQLKPCRGWSQGQAELCLRVLKCFSEALNAAKAGHSERNAIFAACA